MNVLIKKHFWAEKPNLLECIQSSLDCECTCGPIAFPYRPIWNPVFPLDRPTLASCNDIVALHQTIQWQNLILYEEISFFGECLRAVRH